MKPREDGMRAGRRAAPDGRATWGLDAGATITARASAPPARHDEARRLTVPELERYIQKGCLCSVCEFARAEIHALKQPTSR